MVMCFGSVWIVSCVASGSLVGFSVCKVSLLITSLYANCRVWRVACAEN